MERSETIAEIAAALAKAQGQIRGASKDRMNPAFKSKYATLASVWDACREALSTHGLAVVQSAESESDESIAVVTTLAHASGQWMSSRLVVRPVKKDPQGVGSAITYARRYALASFVGVAPDDDDGEAASGRAHEERPARAPEPKSEPSGGLTPTDESDLHEWRERITASVDGAALDACLSLLRKKYPKPANGQPEHAVVVALREDVERRRASFAAGKAA